MGATCRLPAANLTSTAHAVEGWEEGSNGIESVALFRKKHAEGDEGVETKASDDVFEPQPEKARTWFEYARTAADSSNFEYALTCYANGIKLDPGLMSAHESMYDVAVRYLQAGGKPATSRELRSIGDSHTIAKFAAAEFAWMKDVQNGSLALKALAAAVKSEQLEYGNWIAAQVLTLLRKAKKLTKSPFMQAMNLCRDAGAWNQAIAAGELALQIDPSDNDLDAELKDLSAQRAMDQGGYERAAEEGAGGFRGFVKDLEKQRQLEEEEALVQSGSTEERNLLRARRAHEENPRSTDTINKLAQLLKRSDRPEDQEEAHRLYTTGYETLGEYRFRMAAGDIRIDQLRRETKRAHERLNGSPEDAGLRAEYESVLAKLLELRAAECDERVAKYPTDRHRKFEAGEVRFDLGDYEAAMEHFQKAKDEPKLRARAGLLLGKCFAAVGWHLDAIGELRDTAESLDAGQRDLELHVRYELMCSLIEHAKEEKSIDLAKDALEICSAIMRKDIGYREIRAKRREIDALVKELG